MVREQSRAGSVGRASWARRVTVVGLAALLSGGCLEASADDEASGSVDGDVDTTIDVAEEVSDTSSGEAASDGTSPTGRTDPTQPGSTSLDTPLAGEGAETDDPIDDPTDGPVTTAGPTITTTRPSTTVRETTTSTAAPATTAPTATSAGTSSGLELLTVAAEPARSGYDRDLFPHWSDTNASGCDARQDTLAAQVIGLPQVDLFDRCVIVEGDWYSIYDGVMHAGSPSELDVDHVVSLAEAWDSGASTWSRDRRRAFANDPRNLIAVTASSNRSKGDRDLGEWRPAQRSAWCVTATMTVETKAAFGLSIDPVERSAIIEMLGACGGSDQVTIGRGASTPVPPPVSPAPATTAATAPTTAAPAPPPAEEAAPGCVDINSAGVVDLDRIIHIGPERAADILALRPFSAVADMDRIPGIGSGRLADIVAQGLACVP